MTEQKYCDKCLSKYVEDICPICKDKGLPKVIEKKEGKGK